MLSSLTPELLQATEQFADVPQATLEILSRGAMLTHVQRVPVVSMQIVSLQATEPFVSADRDTRAIHS